MSRGFVKEGDQEELPIIPPRAPLPHGSANYVTPDGYKLLLKEKDELEKERNGLSKNNETEYRHATTFIDGKIKLLKERIDSAQVLYPEERPQDEVRFGAIVTFDDGKEKQTFQIVGVDESDVKLGKLAFTAPIAKSLTGRKVGEIVEFKKRGRTQKMKILKIEY